MAARSRHPGLLGSLFLRLRVCRKKCRRCADQTEPKLDPARPGPRDQDLRAGWSSGCEAVLPPARFRFSSSVGPGALPCRSKGHFALDGEILLRRLTDPGFCSSWPNRNVAPLETPVVPRVFRKAYPTRTVMSTGLAQRRNNGAAHV